MMKKDIEWLRRTYEEVKNKAYKQFAEAENGSEWETINNAINSILKQVLISIDQLDEPEVLSQEWINEHITDGHNVSLGEKVVYADDLDGVLVPKQALTPLKIGKGTESTIQTQTLLRWRNRR